MDTKKYMFLKNTFLEVPIKAKKEYFNFKNEKYKVKLHESIERLFIFHLYGDRNRAELARWFLEFIDKHMAPQDIDELITIFTDNHPAKNAGDQPFENYPLYATEKDGMSIPIPGHACVISLENEKELMAIVCKYKRKALPYLQGWFQNFRARYGLDYWKTCKDFQDFYLAQSFLNQHGICSKLMSNEEIGNREVIGQFRVYGTLAVIVISFFLLVINKGFWEALFIAFLIGIAIYFIIVLIGMILVFFDSF
jgi:hypothetical protein